MREIFKGLIGITLLISLFLVFDSIIKEHAPDLELMTSVTKGFLYLTLLMGIIVILWSVVQLIKDCCLGKN